MPDETVPRVTKSRLLGDDLPQLHEAGLAACGETRIHADYRQDGRSETSTCVHICSVGRLSFAHDEQEYVLNPGDFVITPKGQGWSYGHARSACTFLWLRCPSPGPLDVEKPMRRGRLDLDGLAAAYGLLYGESLGRARSTLIYHCAMVLMHLVVDQLRQPHDRLGALWRTVDARLDLDWNLDDLATAAGMGRESLRQRCVAVCGHPPLHQVTVLRMRRAAQIFEEDGLPVQTVAGMVGYANVFAFSRAFKRLMGRSPSTWTITRG